MYKIGDEVLIKGTIAAINQGVRKNICEVETCFDSSRVYNDEIAGITAEKAWEIAKKIALMPENGGISGVDLNEIFGTTVTSRIFTENTVKEAEEKIEAWEESKNFHVGDVVEKINETDRRRGVVFKVCKKAVLVLHSDFSNRWFEKEEIRKTGETIDIEAFMKQIRGEKK
jgi:hypothetical protein